jgi:nicotinamide-nucleotide amidase
MKANLVQLATEVGAHLTLKKIQLVTAESCTGGGLAYYITQVPGSSSWFERGFVSYSNQSKQDLLKVNAQTLTIEGAVSQAVALEMATGALCQSLGQVSIAITGIAGPEGSSSDKPVGTVWIALAQHNRAPRAKLWQFSGDRNLIREQTIERALQWLLRV